LDEISEVIRVSRSADGGLDLRRFGQEGLRSVNPTLAFKVLSNMPICFVSICEQVHGPNAIYTPWEGQGAQAIQAGMRAIQDRRSRCALVGGCDLKSHELAFISLEQHGVFRSWSKYGIGPVPGDGAVFLVLEEASKARGRGAKVYAWLAAAGFSSQRPGVERSQTYSATLRKVTGGSPLPIGWIVSAADRDPAVRRDEKLALESLGIEPESMICPKEHLGDLFAGAAALQVALGALLAQRAVRRVLVNCFGPGSEQAAFALATP
jgi:3-oxoacyl-[acyl-carrier-protein] synthase II